MKNAFDYSSLNPILKFSNWLSWRAVVSNLKVGNWLDIMPGEQMILQNYQSENKKISEFYAIDQSLKKNLQNKNFHLKENFIDKKLPYKNGTFDNITFINGLEHLWYRQEILSECFRILKSHGRLQIVVPTWFGKPFLEFVAFRINIQSQIFESMNDHKIYYDEKTLWPMLVKAGFQPRYIKLRRIKFFCSLYAYVSKE
jgi:ubiquinone/menaquinone biosynthesis C-methylase UbiE